MAVGTIVRVWKETPRLHGVSIDVELGETHARPGQFLLVNVGPKSPSEGPANEVIPLAIASAPRVRPLELLFDATGRAKVEVGCSIDVGEATGAGFDLEPARGKDVLVFAVGSAISAVRPVLDMVAADRAGFGRVTFFYSAREEIEQAYRSRDPIWRDASIDVRRSNGLDWVQDAFRASPVPLSNAVAFVVGMKEMELAVRDTLVEAGLSPSQISSNI
ncbi:MAG: hypothetical protein HYV07_03945 [Deltaproteobacteria bacterium]|nr:hypothetical protein [Deltaproteobacteria bacterium]